MLHGFDPSMITGYKAFNMSEDGGDLPLQKVFILNYILKHCPKTKSILSSLDAGWLYDTVGKETLPMGLTSKREGDINMTFIIISGR